MYHNDFDRLAAGQLQQSLTAITRSWVEQFSASSLINRYLSEQLTSLNLANFKINVPDIYIGLSNLNLDQLTGVSDLARQINALMNESAFAQIHDLMADYDLLIKRLVVDLSVFQTISEQLSYTFTDFLAPVTETNEVIDAFRAAGWPIAPSMTREFKIHVVSLHQNGKTRYVSRSIIGYYHRKDFDNLTKAVDGWAHNPIFAPRMHVFKAALKAHQKGDYVLSIPALFPQVEGILNEYVSENNLPVRVGKIKRVYEAVLGDTEDVSLTVWAITNSLLYLFQHNIYAPTSFEIELKKSIKNRSITRHTVLHGIAPNYDSAVLSLKLLLLLDALSQLQPYEEGIRE